MTRKTEIQECVPTIQEAVRFMAESLAGNRLNKTQQIREAFDDIVALQERGITQIEIVNGINEAGVKISLSHFRNIMFWIKKRRERKQQREIANPTPAAYAVGVEKTATPNQANDKKESRPNPSSFKEIRKKSEAEQDNYF